MARDPISVLAERTRELDECEAARGRMQIAAAALLFVVLVLVGTLTALCVSGGQP